MVSKANVKKMLDEFLYRSPMPRFELCDAYTFSPVPKLAQQVTELLMEHREYRDDLAMEREGNHIYVVKVQKRVGR